MGRTSNASFRLAQKKCMSASYLTDLFVRQSCIRRYSKCGKAWYTDEFEALFKTR